MIISIVGEKAENIHLAGLWNKCPRSGVLSTGQA